MKQKMRNHIRACGQVTGFLSHYHTQSRGEAGKSAEEVFTDYCLDCEHAMRYFSLDRPAGSQLQPATVSRALGFRDASGPYRAIKRAIDRLDWDRQRRAEIRKFHEVIFRQLVSGSTRRYKGNKPSNTLLFAPLPETNEKEITSLNVNIYRQALKTFFHRHQKQLRKEPVMDNSPYCYLVREAQDTCKNRSQGLFLLKVA